jgi:DNA replication and repair protein RecF
VHLRQLNLFNFKNIEEAQLRFQSDIICLLGKNGSGKTTLLDAIYYLSFTKSAINPSDSQNIKQGQSQFIIKGEFDMAFTRSSRSFQEDQMKLDAKEINLVRESPSPGLPRFLAGERAGVRPKEVICAYQSGQKKIIREDGRDCIKFSEHVGKYPVVLISPQDIELIWDGSEMRRKFFDSLISQLDKPYLENLIVYTNQLKQRNSLLRAFAESGKTDPDLVASYDQKIIPAGNYIFSKRKQFVADFLPFFKKQYQFLVEGSREEVHIQYRSDLEKSDFADLLNKNLPRDILLQRTSAGIHRDDLEFLINQNELKRLGSQGQQKSFLIALKLAEFQSIAEAKLFKPILLLDDIFDKLDDQRIHQLMLLISQGTFGQLFITDARQGRSQEILKEANVSAQVFTVENGTFTLP